MRFRKSEFGVPASAGAVLNSPAIIENSLPVVLACGWPAEAGTRALGSKRV